MGEIVRNKDKIDDVSGAAQPIGKGVYQYKIRVTPDMMEMGCNKRYVSILEEAQKDFFKKYLPNHSPRTDVSYLKFGTDFKTGDEIVVNICVKEVNIFGFILTASFINSATNLEHAVVTEELNFVNQKEDLIKVPANLRGLLERMADGEDVDSEPKVRVVGSLIMPDKFAKRVADASIMEEERPKRPICPHLQRHYDFSSKKKQKFLKTHEAQFLFKYLPPDVSKILRKGFLTGTHGSEMEDWDKVVGFFQNNSQIIPALTENPGTFTMLEKMYHFQPVKGVIDNYFKMGMASGQALRNRYDAVNNHAIYHINEILARQDNCLMIDIGSGPCRNSIEICLRNSAFRKKVKIDCIDIDSVAIVKGYELIGQYGFTNIEFIYKNIARLRRRYLGNVDYGLLIGILCGLTRTEKVMLLRILKPYFKKGAKLMAASLLDEMAEKDLLCAYILRETTGWGLQYPPLGELKKIFEEAGWKYGGYFQDEPTQLYEIGVGIAI